MKAIVYTQYGPPDVLQFKDVAKPVPKDDEVLIKLCAASVNILDLGVMGGYTRLISGGLLKPKHTVLGSDIAGRVEAGGRRVKRVSAADGGGAAPESVHTSM